MSLESLNELLELFWGQSVLYAQDEFGDFSVVRIADLSDWCAENGWDYSFVHKVVSDNDFSKTALVMKYDGSFHDFYQAEEETQVPPGSGETDFIEWAEAQSPDRLDQYFERGH